MYLIREVFNAKPGKAKELVKMFKQAAPHMEKQEGMKNMQIMTDATGDYWTVVIQSEMEDMGSFFSHLRGATASEELKTIMKGYIDLVEGGHREIFKIE
jgi:heme-degrading monooxygenase HmoA